MVNNPYNIQPLPQNPQNVTPGSTVVTPSIPQTFPMQQPYTPPQFTPQPILPVNYVQQPQMFFQPIQAPTPQPIYSFDQLTGTKRETREYRNEAGQSMFIEFVNNIPLTPIPEGYTEYKPEETKAVDPTKDVDKAVQTATVTGESEPTGDYAEETGSFGLSLGTMSQEDQDAALENTSVINGFTTDFNAPAISPMQAIGLVASPSVMGIAGALTSVTQKANAIAAVAKEMNIEMGYMEALSNAVLGLENTEKGKAMTSNVPSFMSAINKASQNAYDNLEQLGFSVLPAAGLVIDPDQNYSYTTPQAFFNQISRYGLLLDKTEKAELKGIENAAKGLGLSGRSIESFANQVHGLMDDTGVTATEAAAQIGAAIAAESAMSGQPGRGADPGQPGDVAVSSDEAMGVLGDVDEGGSIDDVGTTSTSSSGQTSEGPEPDSPDPADAQSAAEGLGGYTYKGSLITKRKASGELKPKFKERKGLAARK